MDGRERRGGLKGKIENKSFIIIFSCLLVFKDNNRMEEIGGFILPYIL